MNRAKHALELGAKYPYDAPDCWWNTDTTKKPPKAKDWAHVAARGVLSNLNDRRGIKQEFANVDEAVRREIVETLAEIIREAYKTQKIKENTK